MNFRRFGFRLAALAVAPVLLMIVVGMSRGGVQAEPIEYQEVTFTTHAGPGTHPEDESKKYKLAQEKIRWFDGSDVGYEINGGTGPEEAAVQRAVDTFDGFITTRVFNHEQDPSDTNPCTGQANSVSWVDGDGPGGALALAGVCFELKKRAGESYRRIAGFRIQLDNFDTWSPSGEAGKVDIENVTAHEMGHVAGLNHVEHSKEGCLTMYVFSGLGETQKRTPGWGDKRGLDRLYDTGDDGPGPGCGS